MALRPNPNPVVELKSAALTLVAVVVRTADLGELAQALRERFDDNPEGLDGEPVAIDLAFLRDADEAIDFVALIDLLRGHAMRPIAVRGGSPAQMEAAYAAGLVEAHSATPTRADPVSPSMPPTPAALPTPPAEAPAAPAAGAAAIPSARPTLVIDRPLRSGQQVYARGADLIVLAAVSVGAEVIADGHIHVYAPLRG
ncbi:MAG: septum site-determining protein MinC, partial [Burkholderiaceae bacterium]